jgi:hypothetical protein
MPLYEPECKVQPRGDSSRSDQVSIIDYARINDLSPGSL